ncbi:MAG: polysaccharide biosynthesis/export family protein [Thiohalocapsa sp.]
MQPLFLFALRSCLGAFVVALALAACSLPPTLPDVLAQANRGGKVAFAVVKIDDAVLQTVLERPQPAFGERFKRYVPPPELKIAVGDTVSVMVWESGPEGLFGNSLTELSLPAGAASRLRTGEALPALPGLASRPGGLSASPETLARLSGILPSAPSETFGGTFGAARGETAPGDKALGDKALGDKALGETAAAAATPEEPELGAGAPGKPAAALVDVAEESGRAGTRIPDQQVGSDGGISIPYGGRIAVAGKTPAEVQQAIEQRLTPRALDPQVLVVVKRSLANSVAVAGEIVGGKRVRLSPGGERLLQVIAAAGGARAPVHETFVSLSRGGVSATISLAALVADPAQDIFAEPGDVLTLLRRRQSFTVFGAAGRNATITFDSDRLSLEEALAKGHGLIDLRADPRAVFLFRYEPAAVVRALGQPIAADAPPGLAPIVYRLDLADAKSYLLARRFPVRDKDTIFIANAEIRPVAGFFEALSKLSGAVQIGGVVCTYVRC